MSETAPPAPPPPALTPPPASPLNTSTTMAPAVGASTSHATASALPQCSSEAQPSSSPARHSNRSVDEPAPPPSPQEVATTTRAAEGRALQAVAPPPAPSSSAPPSPSPSPSPEMSASQKVEDTSALLLQPEHDEATTSLKLAILAAPSEATVNADTTALEKRDVSSQSPFVPTPSPSEPALPAPPPLPTAPTASTTSALTASGNAIATIAGDQRSTNVAYEASEEDVRRRGLLWREDSELGVGGLASPNALHVALASLEPVHPVPDLKKPASPAVYDKELEQIVRTFVYENIATKFVHDEKSEELHDVSARALNDKIKSSPKAKGPFRFDTRTEDEDHLLMEQRELTLDDINLTLIIHGIDKKRGESMCRKSLLDIEYFRERWDIQPQALSRFNRREEFWKVIFNSAEEAKSLADTTVNIRVAHYPQTVTFKRPIMYRMLMNDPKLQVSSDSRDDLLRRSRIIVGNDDRKRKAHPLSDQFEVGDVPSKRRRVDLDDSLAPTSAATTESKKAPAKSGRGRRGRTPKKAKTPPPTLRDDPAVKVPDTVHLIPYSPEMSYSDEDEALLKGIAVILRARRMPQDQSIWFLCGPRSAQVSRDGARNVMWVEAPVLYARCAALTFAFFEKVTNWSKDELFGETEASQALQPVEEDEVAMKVESAQSKGRENSDQALKEEAPATVEGKSAAPREPGPNITENNEEAREEREVNDAASDLMQLNT